MNQNDVPEQSSGSVSQSALAMTTPSTFSNFSAKSIQTDLKWSQFSQLNFEKDIWYRRKIRKSMVNWEAIIFESGLYNQSKIKYTFEKWTLQNGASLKDHDKSYVLLNMIS